MVLESVKAQEAIESLKLILNDEDAKKVIAAWSLERPAFTDRPLKENESPVDALMQLWDTVEPNLVKLSMNATVPLNQTREIFDRLKSTRLIYPDGSIHKNARVILRSEVQAYGKRLLL